jgi:hypothetical protein
VIFCGVAASQQPSTRGGQPSHGKIVIVPNVPLSLASHYDTAAVVYRHSGGQI